MKITVKRIVARALCSDQKILDEIFAKLKREMELFTKNSISIVNEKNEPEEEWIINPYIDGNYDVDEKGKRLWKEGENIEISFVKWVILKSL